MTHSFPDEEKKIDKNSWTVFLFTHRHTTRLDLEGKIRLWPISITTLNQF